jgi:protein involved in polysaccharide export with SLBB domain
MKTILILFMFVGLSQTVLAQNVNPATVKVSKLTEAKPIPASENMKKIFGFHFFNSTNLSFSPSVNIPVSDSYAVGVGDELVIDVYGASQMSYNLTVQTNGSVYVTDLGPIQVAGLPFYKVEDKLKKSLIGIYSGLKGVNPNTFVDVSAGQLKAVMVNVIGEVAVPGTYTVPATASVFNVLYLAGGPNENGSFRMIDVIRDGKVLNSVDVYAYMIDGETQSNIQLRDQDIVLVRPYINRVKIDGEFKRKGLFETKDNETVSDLLRYAGGFTHMAYTHRLELYRNNTRSLSFVDVEACNYAQTKLSNGDRLVASKIINRLEDRVSILGAVFRPGNYEMVEGLKLSQLIIKAEGVKEEAFMERAVLTRKKEDMRSETISFSVYDILSGKTDFDLKREDRIQISSIFDMHDKRTVQIVGEVRSPGTYEWSENFKMADLIFLAGGFKEHAEVSLRFT